LFIHHIKHENCISKIMEILEIFLLLIIFTIWFGYVQYHTYYQNILKDRTYVSNHWLQNRDQKLVDPNTPYFYL